MGAKTNIVRISVKASPAERRRRFHRNTAYAAFWVSTGLHVEHGWRCSTSTSIEGQKAGVQGIGGSGVQFRVGVQVFRCLDLGFRFQVFRCLEVWGLGLGFLMKLFFDEK